ncbi:MAG: 16S rRNA (cytidine(1402)-2'-O)-methyltransferase [bacterium]
MNQQPETGTLYLVATPIGNLEDITFRAVRILSEVDAIYAEDTRQSSKLLHHYEIKDKPLRSFHEHNEQQQTGNLITLLQEGKSLALVSDGGCPTIADPGFKLVRACTEANIKVVPIPGANAAITAIMASGLPTDEHSFLGFLPRTSGKKEKAFARWKDYTGTLIIYESPHRLTYTLETMNTVFEGKGKLVIAREMTKLYEEFVRGSFSEVLAYFNKKNTPKGEFVILWHQ